MSYRPHTFGVRSYVVRIPWDDVTSVSYLTTESTTPLDSDVPTGPSSSQSLGMSEWTSPTLFWSFQDRGDDSKSVTILLTLYLITTDLLFVNKFTRNYSDGILGSSSKSLGFLGLHPFTVGPTDSRPSSGEASVLGPGSVLVCSRPDWDSGPLLSEDPFLFDHLPPTGPWPSFLSQRS